MALALLLVVVAAIQNLNDQLALLLMQDNVQFTDQRWKGRKKKRVALARQSEKKKCPDKSKTGQQERLAAAVCVSLEVQER